MHTSGMQIIDLDLTAISGRYSAAWAAHDPDAIVALHTKSTRFWTRDTFIDAMQLQAMLGVASA